MPLEESAKFSDYIDHTLLRPEATESEVLRVCKEAMEFRFRTVCIERKWLPLVVASLHGSQVLPITVIGFPSGSESTAEKTEQARESVKAGARELDMVLNRDLLRARRYAEVFEDIRAVVAQVVPVKVILETSELTDDEKRIACALAKAAGAKFVKTSTGFSRAGATEHDVRLMRETVGDDMGVKASGGVRSSEDALKMIRAGANRLGTSASVEIVKGAAVARGGY